MAQLACTLLESTYDLVAYLDADGLLTYANRACSSALGLPTSELAGRRWNEFVAVDSRDGWMAACEALLGGRRETPLKLELTGSNGQRVFIEGVLASRGGDSGASAPWWLIARDVSERRRVEEQLLRAQRLESIGTLTGGIAHDLNNVLAPVLLCVGLIRSGNSDRERKEFLNIIEKSALRGSDLVRQVLSFARGAENERLPLHPKHVAREIVSILRETFPKTIRVVYDLPNELWHVSGNPTQLNQILLNLCVNARDAMPGGGTLTLSGRNLVVGADDLAGHPEARAGEYVVLSVSDTGTGIAAGIRERIFDPFFTTKPRGLGTGLGLATVMTIVRSHGGFVSLDTEEGRGTAFHVHLPAHHMPADVGSTLPAEPAPPGRRELVLVVDDERPVRDLIERTLTAGGYRVVTANDGINAVARFMTFGSEIKILVSDLLMPRLDGRSAIRAIRKSYPDIRIVAISGNPPDEVMENLAAAGIDRFVAKPFTGQELLHAVHEVLGSREDSPAPGVPPVSGPGATQPISSA
jgi:two-component system, cell cycle sensor histidine kinase and response regulator CckA